MVTLTLRIKDWIYTRDISLPGVTPPPPPICTPPQILNPLTGKCETPVPTCTPPQVYNPLTGRCETPLPTECPDLSVDVLGNIQVPSAISASNLPFYIYLTKVKEVCASDPSKTTSFNGQGTVSLGGLTSTFDVTKGIVDIDLSKLIDLSTIPVYLKTSTLIIKIKDWRYTRDISLPGVTPPPPPTEICTLGDKQILPCSDGTTIITANCQKDTTTGMNRWVATGKTCLQPPPTSEYKSVKILPEGTPSFPKANEGETITITATVTCKKDGNITKPRDTAYLIIDGVNTDNSLVESGSVTFEWQATAIPINIHTICVKVPPTDACKGYGQDCKKITVSPTILSPAIQLAKERASASEQRKLLEQARQQLREELVSSKLTPPVIPPVVPPVIPPIIPPVVQPVVPPVIPPVIPPIITPTPDTGSIELIGLPILITPAIPVYLYIDDTLKGRIYDLPKTFDNIPTGIRTLYVKAGAFNSPTKTVIVTKDKTSSIIL